MLNLLSRFYLRRLTPSVREIPITSEIHTKKYDDHCKEYSSLMDHENYQNTFKKQHDEKEDVDDEANKLVYSSS